MSPPPARRVAAPGTPSRLVCQTGPLAGEAFRLQGDQLAIGRGAEAGIFLPDASVSRRHALVCRTGAGWALRDLGSGNGTRLNGQLVLAETPLAEGDVIALGDTRLAFIAGDDAGPFWAASSPEGADLAPRRPAGLAGVLPALGRALGGGWRRALARVRGSRRP